VGGPTSRVAETVDQVRHSVPLDNLGVTEEFDRTSVVAEEPDPGAEAHGGEVEVDLVDEPRFDGLAGNVPRGHSYIPLPSEGLRPFDRGGDTWRDNV
jgi:hypothetical protein